MEQHLLFLLNREWTHPLLDRVLGTLSSLEFWAPLLVVGAALLLWKLRIRGVACLLLCVLGICINETLIAQPLKKWTRRGRPHQLFEGIRRVDLAPVKPRILAAALPMQVHFSGPPNPEDKVRLSFPSAHVLNAMTLGVVLSLFLRRRLWWLPLLMAWSRVYTGAHWPTDVLASLCIGLPSNLGLVLGAELFWRKVLPRWRPDWTATHPALVFSLAQEETSRQPAPHSPSAP